jgi:hypothetical protein
LNPSGRSNANKISEKDEQPETKPSNETIKTQYEKLAEDWRRFNSIIWGIPSVAVAIMTGIIVTAYQSELEGWPRFTSLAVGALFLFALAVELSKIYNICMQYHSC